MWKTEHRTRLSGAVLAYLCTCSQITNHIPDCALNALRHRHRRARVANCSCNINIGHRTSASKGGYMYAHCTHHTAHGTRAPSAVHVHGPLRLRSLLLCCSVHVHLHADADADADVDIRSSLQIRKPKLPVLSVTCHTPMVKVGLFTGVLCLGVCGAGALLQLQFQQLL